MIAVFWVETDVPAELEHLTESFERHASGVFPRIGEDFAEELGRAAPRRSGRLARSFRVLALDEDSVEVGSDLLYANVQEQRFGYVERALEREQEIVDAAADEAFRGFGD